MPVQWLLVGGALLLGAFLRLYRLEELPPGLHHDEAFYGLDALRILRDGYRPVFLDANFGREPLFAYMLATAFAFVEAGPFVIRLVAALSGLLTLPGVYLLAKELFPSPSRGISRVAVLSVLALAVSYWHINFSRLGFRAILLPLFEIWFFYFFWHALRTGRLPWYLGAGLLLGASQYTYVAARLLPIATLVVLVWVAVTQRRTVALLWKGALLMSLAAVLVALPLALYFLANPDAFALRLGQVSILAGGQGDQWRGIYENLLKTFGLFTLTGDENWRQNLPGRPALDLLSSIAFLVGVALTVWRIRRPEYAFLAFWGLIMLVPTILSDYAPNFLRAIGVIPAMVIVMALGLDALVSWRQRAPVVGAQLGYAMAAVWFVIAGWTTYHDYFRMWGTDPELYWAFDIDKATLSERIRMSSERKRVYIDQQPHPTTQFLLSAPQDSNQRQTAGWFDGEACVVVPTATDSSVAYFLRPDSSEALTSLRRIFPSGIPKEAERSLTGELLFTEYEVPAGSGFQAQPSVALVADFDRKLSLLGYDLETSDFRNNLRFTLYWQAQQRMTESYTVFIHLLGAAINPATGDRIWAQRDMMPCNGFYRTTVWEPGEVIVDRYQIPISATVLPGDYELAIGVYELGTLTRLPVRNPAGEIGDDRIVIRHISIER